MSNIMTAKQAKNFMKAYKSDYIKGQLKFISYKISEAIQQGKDFITIKNISSNADFDKQIEIILKSLGYDVETDRGSEFITISWGE